MRARGWNWSVGLLGLGLLGGMAPTGSERPAAPPRCTLPPSLRPPPADASQAALREAARLLALAIQQVDDQCAVLEAWDPALDTDRMPLLRRQLLAEDHYDRLRRARALAEQGAALARTPHQRWRALRLLTTLACAAGNHRAELEQARRLVHLTPGDPSAREWLQRARQCNGLAAP